MMKKLRMTITLIFFIFMVFLSVFARKIHNYGIPNVTTSKLSQEIFISEIELEDGTKGTSERNLLAIPKGFIKYNWVYTIVERQVNGEMRTFISQKFINVDKKFDNKKFYAVKDGIEPNDNLIIKSDKPLNEGDEVYILNSH